MQKSDSQLSSQQADDPAQRAVEHAIALYESLASLLERVVKTHLDGPLTGEPLSDDDHKLIREHQKAIQSVLDFETILLKKRPDAAAQPRSTLDLDAARTEVARRLDRLLARDTAAPPD